MAGGDVKVEAGFGSNPFDASYSWTDITEYVRFVSITRGRSRVRDEYSPGVATITVNNEDRRFEPEFAAGAYYPDVKPMVPIRVSGTYSSTDYPKILGYVESWPQIYQGGGFDPVSQIVAVDGHKILNLTRISASIGGDVSGTMIGDVLDEAGWPAGLRDLDTGASTLQGVTADNQSALTLLRTVARSESGAVFLDNNGQVAFFDRRHYSGLSAAATFSDDGSDQKYVDLVLSYDDTQLWNRVTVSRTGGTDQTAEDSTSITAYGPRNLSVAAALHRNDNESMAAAEWLVSRWKDPRLRVEQLHFRMPAGVDDDRWTQGLTREIGDVITVERTPPGGGAQIAKTLIIEGITIGARPGGSWDVTWRLSDVTDMLGQGGTLYSEGWTLGTSALGTDTKLVY